MDKTITLWSNLVKILVIFSCRALSSSNTFLVNYSLRNKLQMTPRSFPSFVIKLEIKSSQAYLAKQINIYLSKLVKHIKSSKTKIKQEKKKPSQLSSFLIKHNRSTVLCTSGNFKGYRKV